MCCFRATPQRNCSYRKTPGFPGRKRPPSGLSYRLVALDADIGYPRLGRFLAILSKLRAMCCFLPTPQHTRSSQKSPGSLGRMWPSDELGDSLSLLSLSLSLYLSTSLPLYLGKYTRTRALLEETPPLRRINVFVLARHAHASAQKTKIEKSKTRKSDITILRSSDPSYRRFALDADIGFPDCDRRGAILLISRARCCYWLDFFTPTPGTGRFASYRGRSPCSTFRLRTVCLAPLRPIAFGLFDFLIFRFFDFCANALYRGLR